MRTIVSSFVAAAFVVAVGTSQAFASDKMMMKCPKGSTYVSGHMDKMSHKMTKGYCRKKPMMGMKKM